MEDILVPIAIFGSMVAGIILFTKTITDYRLRKKLIDKGLVNENAGSILKNESFEAGKYSSLKWGLIVLTGGIGLIIINYMPYDGDEPMPYGVFAVSVAVGFLIYYFYVKRDMKGQ